MNKQAITMVVKNPQGLHMRPATHLVKLLQRVKSSVTFTHKHQSVNAKSILSILMLAVGYNGRVKIEVEGEDSDIVIKMLQKAFEEKFGESL